MSKWIAEFELEDGDRMPEHMDLEYHGVKLDFHCRPIRKTYEDGLNEAWECMRKIVITKRFRTISGYYDYLREIFGTNSANKVLETNSASEAIAKVKEYEEKQKQTDDEIKVGDEVIHDGEQVGIITQVDEYGYTIMDNCGKSGYYITDDIRKTNRNFTQIDEILKQMKEE